MPKRVRVKLIWSPLWDGPVKHWAIKFNRDNQWRRERIHDDSDLLQDAYLVFMKICRRYPRVVEAAHFMALFKTALRNEWHDKSKRDGRKRACGQDLTEALAQLYAGRIGELTNAGYASLLLAEAPDELKLALALLAEHPESLRAHRHRGQPRENLNMKLRRILSLDASCDVVGDLKALLT